MGFPQKRIAWISPDEYLRLEEASLTKREYLDGVIYDWQGYGPRAMAGASITHNQLSLNVAITLRQQLRGGPCRVLIADVRMRLADRSAYFYPDVMVMCNASEAGTSVEVIDPCVVVEVLSASTEDFDRGDKFASYRQIEALQSYVLIDPLTRCVEVYARSANWQAVVSEGDATAPLACLDLSLSIPDVFEGI